MSPSQTIENEPTRTQAFAEWMQVNSRALTIGAVVVALGAAGFWFYLRSNQIKRANAERGLNQAKQSLAAGNAALAQSDLQRVADRYKGTPAGAQAAMLLAQVNYDAAKVQEGLNILEPYQSEAAAKDMLPAVWSLTGDGQMALGKPGDAASSYRKAAEATSLPGVSAMYLTKAARALGIAGKNDEARQIWQKLANDPDAVAVQAEARVRLGELEVKPAGRS